MAVRHIEWELETYGDLTCYGSEEDFVEENLTEEEMMEQILMYYDDIAEAYEILKHIKIKRVWYED